MKPKIVPRRPKPAAAETIEKNGDQGPVSPSKRTRRAAAAQKSYVVDDDDDQLEDVEESVNGAAGEDNGQLGDVDEDGAPRRGQKRARKLSIESDDRALTVRDLLVYNPAKTEGQLEMEEQARKRKEQREREALRAETRSSAKKKETAKQPEQPSSPKRKTSKRTTGAPQMKLNEKGELEVDMDSLVQQVEDTVDRDQVVVEDYGLSLTNYASFRRPRYDERRAGLTVGKMYGKRWTTSDTDAFYKGLVYFGTDFELISNIIFDGRRTRTDVKNKYKTEERRAPALIDSSLKKGITARKEIPPNLTLTQLKKFFYEEEVPEAPKRSAPPPKKRKSEQNGNASHHKAKNGSTTATTATTTKPEIEILDCRVVLDSGELGPDVEAFLVSAPAGAQVSITGNNRLEPIPVIHLSDVDVSNTVEIDADSSNSCSPSKNSILKSPEKLKPKRPLRNVHFDFQKHHGGPRRSIRRK